MEYEVKNILSVTEVTNKDGYVCLMYNRIEIPKHIFLFTIEIELEDEYLVRQIHAVGFTTLAALPDACDCCVNDNGFFIDGTGISGVLKDHIVPSDIKEIAEQAAANGKGFEEFHTTLIYVLENSHVIIDPELLIKIKRSTSFNNLIYIV